MLRAINTQIGMAETEESVQKNATIAHFIKGNTSATYIMLFWQNVIQ